MIYIALDKPSLINRFVINYDLIFNSYKENYFKG